MNAIEALASKTATAGGSAAGDKSGEIGSADRFLKLLVAQMQNQDPLNPLDNAQVTSQMAQINTVNGVEKLNVTMQGLNAQMLQMQMLQGAGLVGREITVEGSQLVRNGDVGVGGFELLSTADQVQVEVVNPGGRVVETLQLGTQPAGRHGFEWDPGSDADLAGYSFRITASAGTTPVSATPLMLDRVLGVRNVGDKLTLDTALSGALPYTAVKAVN